MPWYRTAFKGLCAATLCGHQIFKKNTTGPIPELENPIMEPVTAQEQHVSNATVGSVSIVWSLLGLMYPFITEILTQAECVIILTQLCFPLIVTLSRVIDQNLIGVDVIQKLATVHYTLGKRTERLLNMATYPFEAALEWFCDSDLSDVVPSIPSNGFVTKCVGAYIAWLLDQIEVQKASIAAKDKALELEKTENSDIQALIADINDGFDRTTAELAAANDTIAQRDEGAKQHVKQMAEMSAKHDAVQKRIKDLEVQLKNIDNQHDLALKLREKRLDQQEERTKRKLNAQNAKLRATDRNAEIWKSQAQSLKVSAENGVIAQNQLQQERDERRQEQKQASIDKAEYVKVQNKAREALDKANLDTAEDKKAKKELEKKLNAMSSSKQELQASHDRLQRGSEKTKKDAENRESSIKLDYQQQIDKLTSKASQRERERGSLYTQLEMESLCQDETQRRYILRRDELEQIFRSQVKAEAKNITKESKAKLDEVQANLDKLIASSGNLKIDSDALEADNKKLKESDKKLRDNISSLTAQTREALEAVKKLEEVKAKPDSPGQATQQEVLELRTKLATLEEATKYAMTQSDAQVSCRLAVQRREEELKVELTDHIKDAVQRQTRDDMRKEFNEEMRKQVAENIQSELEALAEEKTRLENTFRSALNEKLQNQKSKLEKRLKPEIERQKKRADDLEDQVQKHKDGNAKMIKELAAKDLELKQAKGEYSKTEVSDNDQTVERQKDLLDEFAEARIGGKTDPAEFQAESEEARLVLEGVNNANGTIDCVRLSVKITPCPMSRKKMPEILSNAEICPTQIEDLVKLSGDSQVHSRKQLIRQARAANQRINQLLDILHRDPQKGEVPTNTMLAQVVAPRGDEDTPLPSGGAIKPSKRANTSNTYMRPEASHTTAMTASASPYLLTPSHAHTTVTLPGLPVVEGSQPWKPSGLSPSQGRRKAPDSGFVLPRTGLLDSGESSPLSDAPSESPEAEQQPIDNPETFANYGDLYPSPITDYDNGDNQAPASILGVRDIAKLRPRRNGAGRGLLSPNRSSARIGGPENSTTSGSYQFPVQQGGSMAIDPMLNTILPTNGTALGYSQQQPLASGAIGGQAAGPANLPNVAVGNQPGGFAKLANLAGKPPVVFEGHSFSKSACPTSERNPINSFPDFNLTPSTLGTDASSSSVVPPPVNLTGSIFGQSEQSIPFRNLPLIHSIGLSSQLLDLKQEAKKPEGKQCKSAKSSEEEDQPLSRLERLARRMEKKAASAEGPDKQPDGVVEHDNKD